MCKSILVFYLCFLSCAARAWPLGHGSLPNGPMSESYTDSLSGVFRSFMDQHGLEERKKVKLYQSMIESGIYLKESCSLYAPPQYTTSWMEKQAKRSMASTLQYIGLDTSMKAIGTYAQKLELSQQKFSHLATNIVQNFCSKNLSVFSLNYIKKSLDYYYKNPHENLIPSVNSSPFVSSLFKSQTDSSLSRSNEFDQAIENFKAFCSWGGDVNDYRLMAPYLKNSFIMSVVIKNLLGHKDQFKENSQKVIPVPSQETTQVSCEELICRKVSLEKFKENFPRSKGSTGLDTDLAKLYCHHFKFQDYSVTHTLDEVKKWIKQKELEDPILETNFFISLLTGVPDPIFGVDVYRDLPFVVKSSIDERWNSWATEALKKFSHEIVYEESLKIKVNPIRDRFKIRREGFVLDFSITLGEWDRVVDDWDKLKLTFQLEFSKNYLRNLRSKWNDLNQEMDEEGKEHFKKQIAQFIDLQLEKKEKYFQQKIWNKEFSQLIANELLGQVMVYKGPLFDSFQDEMLRVKVKFSYGVFALNYLHYRHRVLSEGQKIK